MHKEFRFINNIPKYIFSFFQILLVLLFSIIFSAQFLGFLKIYNIVTASVLSIAMSMLVFWFWKEKKPIQLFDQNDDKNGFANHRNQGLFSLIFYLLSIFLLILMIVPIANWPMNTMEKELNWDAGAYHFPKAIELYKTGSVWDFSISYGEYPFGYESLLSFDLLLSDNLSLFPVTHVFIAIFFILSCWFVLIKFTRIPPALLLLTVSVIILSGFLPFFNPWFYLRYIIFTVGKNDLLVTAAILSAIIFTPSGKNNTQVDWIGLGLSSSIALSIKPNSGLLIIFFWVVSFLQLRKIQRLKIIFKSMIPGILLALSGGLWILRNLIAQGKIFQENTYQISNYSIISNITNPDFYLHIPNELKFSMFVFVLSIIFTLLKITKISWRDIILFFFAFLTFILTPASSDPSNPTLLAWRFGIVLLIFQLVILMMMIEPILLFILNWVIPKKYLLTGFLVVVSTPILLFIFWQRDLVRVVPEKSTILERPYVDADAKYPSVFDFVNDNIHDAIVWVEGAQSFYAYDPKFTNSVTRNLPADFIIFVDREDNDIWIDTENWTEIYHDARGMIFMRDQ